MIEPTTEQFHEEWPVRYLSADQLERLQGKPWYRAVFHPTLGLGWDIVCPHCGGQVKCFPDGEHAMRGLCLSCGARGRLMRPVS